MQDEVADCILHSDKDVVVLSPTGSGKTLAFLLPLAQRINTTDDNIQAIVIVPGRELAMQSAAAETVSVKGLLAAQMKMAKEYDIKMKELKEMNVEGKQSIIDNFRQDTGEDTRQTVTRLKTEVVEESAVAVDETKNVVSDAKKDSESMLEVDMGSGNTKKTSDTNLVSASIK